MNIHDVSIRAIIEELSTHFAEDKLITYLDYRLPILRVMRETAFESTPLLVWHVSQSNASIGTPWDL